MSVDCPICYEPIKYPVKINGCNHEFCNKCIVGWLTNNSTCPMCRKEVEEHPLIFLSDIEYKNRSVSGPKGVTFGDFKEDCIFCEGKVTDEVEKNDNCDHLFHVNCLNKWKYKHCPCCKADTKIKIYIPLEFWFSRHNRDVGLALPLVAFRFANFPNFIPEERGNFDLNFFNNPIEVEPDYQDQLDVGLLRSLSAGEEIHAIDLLPEREEVD